MALKSSFPNYELFDDIDKAYENFIWKVMAVIDNLAPSKKQLRVHCKIGLMKYHAEIMEKINGIRDKLFKNSKNLACISIKITIRKQGIRYKN